MSTSAVLSRIKVVQAALSTLAMLKINSDLFPPNITPCNGSAYDYVVVGGGIGGSVVSARLVEAGFCVLLIEAGGTSNVESYLPGLVTYVKNTSSDWKYTAEPDGITGACHKASGLVVPKVLGGQGATDFMIYSRGNPSDYAKWSKAVNDDSWEWENMLRYFKKSESLKDAAVLKSPFRKYHGLDGKINITRDSNDVCDEYIKGFELAGEPVPLDNIGNASLGYARALYNIMDGVRNDAGLSYLKPLNGNPKLHISLYSLATKIIFNKGKRAVGVKFMKGGQNITVKARHEVILSAGPIKSPQLLMLSGVGPKKALEKWGIPCLSDIPVGMNLQNLIGAFLVFKRNKRADPKPFGAHKNVAPLVVGYSTVNKSNIYPDYETLNFIIDNDLFQAFCGFSLTFENKICDRLYSQANNSQILTTILSNLRVRSRGQITLRTTNPEDSPKITTAYYSNDKDVDAVVEAIQDFMKIVTTPYFKDDIGLEFIEPSNKCSHLEKGSREYWRCYVLCMTAGTARYVGTNAMGSVVDYRLCVKGMHYFRIVDASVIPYIVSGATSAANAAVAEKAAEMIIAAAK